MTVFHLLRHGEHVLRGRVLAGRTPGVGLSARGRAEIAAAGMVYSINQFRCDKLPRS